MADAAAVRQALYALADQHNGQLTPETVVLAARDPLSPLHAHFSWDDAEAARLRRLDEARRLIRTVRVEITTQHFDLSAPAFIRDPSAGSQQGYVSLGRLRTDADAAREVVITEFARASAALARAKAVAMALGLAGEIEGLVDRIELLSTRAQQDEAQAPS